MPIVLPLYVLTTTLGLIFLKLGTSNGMPVSFSGGTVQFNLNPYALAGLILYIASFGLYVYLISTNDLGYIIPVTAAFVYTLVFIASFFVFKETFTLAKVIGIGLILIGLTFLNLNR